MRPEFIEQLRRLLIKSPDPISPYLVGSCDNKHVVLFLNNYGACIFKRVKSLSGIPISFKTFKEALKDYGERT